MRKTLILLSLLSAVGLSAQGTYFPPTTGTTWETVDPASLGWCTDSIQPLLDFIDANNSKAFIVLKDGRIAIEHYTGTFTQDSVWYWASAGKSLTAFLVGKAQADGLLDINAPSSNYLGTGWTSCTPEQEGAITVRNQLTMTTGLDDAVADLDCTDPACLTYLTDPGTRWSYHNAPYTLLDGVIGSATGGTLNSYVFNTLTATTGMAGLYLPTGYNNVFYSKPRAMARFGLLALNRGVWNGTDILGDDDYFEAMTTPSQSLNPSYGYLWWLNGQPSFMAPGSQFVFPGSMAPNAPVDMVSALGKNGQQLNVVPSMGLVVVRMGNPPDGIGAAVAVLFNDEVWQHLSHVLCTPTSIPATVADASFMLYPDPAQDRLHIRTNSQRITAVEAIGMDGRRHPLLWSSDEVDVRSLAPGTYALFMRMSDGSIGLQRFQIVR